MLKILQTVAFQEWFNSLRDIRARARIQVRIDRLASGNPGDAKPVGGGVVEMRIHFGPGYRLYYIERGSERIVLLGGGDKQSQARDVAAVTRLARTLGSSE